MCTAPLPPPPPTHTHIIRTFLSLLEESSGDVEKTASCFAEHVSALLLAYHSADFTHSLRYSITHVYGYLQAHQFEVYVTYCENKPKSESFIWAYHHTGGTFFEVRGRWMGSVL